MQTADASFDIASTGLSEGQVRERYRRGLVNNPVEAPTKTVKQIVLENIFTFFNMLFIALAVLLILVGSFDELVFLLVIFFNTIIGIVQELISKKKLDSLAIMAQSKAAVIRDGKGYIIPTNDVVKDDVVVFKSGNQIYADAVILRGEVQVNESLITGESDEITKGPNDQLLSGSFIISGECRAMLTHVGEDSYVSKLTIEAKKTKKKDQPKMMQSLTRLLYIIGIAVIPIGIMLFYRQTEILGLSVKEGVENTTAAIIGMIPEGLYLLTSIALAVSVGRLAMKKTLVQDLKCTETLARVDVLCVDKTGTITENTMKVAGVIPLTKDENGKPSVDLAITPEGVDEINLQIADFALNMSNDNQTMEALQGYYVNVRKSKKAVRIQGFSSETKFSALSFGENDSYVFGAPDFVIRNGYRSYASIVEKYMQEGNRVLVYAKCNDALGNDIRGVEPIALVLFTNPVRENARSTFKYFSENDVEIKVISGDNPMTVCAAAKQAGISNADAYIDATTLDTDAKIFKAVSRYTVFGRVKPKQKRVIVKALQKQGHTVAMTGDGVNDVLALKEADCSVAMASGSEVAGKVSDIVLMNSDFANMPDVVAEGRRVINNIERAASLYLVKNIFSLILAIISITAVFAYPLTPSQLMLMTYLTIGIPSFVYALEPNTNRVKGRFLFNVIYKALPAALTDLIIVVGIIVFQALFDFGETEISTMTALLITAVGFFMVWTVGGKPFTWLHAGLFAVLFGLLIIILTVLPQMFSLTGLTLKSGLVFTVFLFTIPTLYVALTTIFDKVAYLCGWIKSKVARKK